MSRASRWIGKPDLVAFAGVTLAALVVRLAFVSIVHPTPISDFSWYYKHAIQLTEGLGYTTNGVPTAYWPPGWPYFLAGVFLLFGPHVYVGEVAQAFLNSVTAGLVFLIARRVAGMPCALAGALLYAFLPSAVEWTAVLGTEPLYTFLWVLVTYIWISVPAGRTAGYAFSGVLLGAAALVRPTALLVWGVLLLYLPFSTKRKTPQAILLPPLIVLCFAVATIAPDLVRNYRIFHTFVLICNTGGTTLWIGNNPDYTPGDVSLHNARLQKMTDDPRTELAADRISEQMALSYIKEHPAQTVVRIIPKLRTLYARDDGPVQYAFGVDASSSLGRAVVIMNRAYYYALLALAVAGLILCLRSYSLGRWQNPAWILPLLNIVYNTVPFLIAPSYDRYHFPSMPFLAVFAGIGLVAVFSRRSAVLTAYSSTDANSRAQAAPV